MVIKKTRVIISQECIKHLIAHIKNLFNHHPQKVMDYYISLTKLKINLQMIKVKNITWILLIHIIKVQNQNQKIKISLFKCQELILAVKIKKSKSKRKVEQKVSQKSMHKISIESR